jgi:hypothetical protein
MITIIWKNPYYNDEAKAIYGKIGLKYLLEWSSQAISIADDLRGAVDFGVTSGVTYSQEYDRLFRATMEARYILQTHFLSPEATGKVLGSNIVDRSHVIDLIHLTTSTNKKRRHSAYRVLEMIASSAETYTDNTKHFPFHLSDIRRLRFNIGRRPGTLEYGKEAINANIDMAQRVIDLIERRFLVDTRFEVSKFIEDTYCDDPTLRGRAYTKLFEYAAVASKRSNRDLAIPFEQSDCDRLRLNFDAVKNSNPELSQKLKAKADKVISLVCAMLNEEPSLPATPTYNAKSAPASPTNV